MDSLTIDRCGVAEVCFPDKHAAAFSPSLFIGFPELWVSHPLFEVPVKSCLFFHRSLDLRLFFRVLLELATGLTGSQVLRQLDAVHSSDTEA